MVLVRCPDSNLMLPREFIDQRKALVKVINEVLEKATNSLSHVRENYFLSLSAKLSKFNPEEFEIAEPIMTEILPPFKSNQMVYFISPQRGFRELLWMVAPVQKGEKLKVEFNKSGVAYLQAKGAMPS